MYLNQFLTVIDFLKFICLAQALLYGIIECLFVEVFVILYIEVFLVLILFCYASRASLCFLCHVDLFRCFITFFSLLIPFIVYFLFSHGNYSRMIEGMLVLRISS